MLVVADEQVVVHQLQVLQAGRILQVGHPGISHTTCRSTLRTNATATLCSAP